MMPALSARCSGANEPVSSGGLRPCLHEKNSMAALFGDGDATAETADKVRVLHWYWTPEAFRQGVNKYSSHVACRSTVT